MLCFTFSFSTLQELKTSKCKEILEKIEDIEESIYEKLPQNPNFPQKTNFDSPKFQTKHKSDNNGNQLSSGIAPQNASINSEQTNERKVPQLTLNINSNLLKKSSMAKTPRVQIANFNYVLDSPQANTSTYVYR